MGGRKKGRRRWAVWSCEDRMCFSDDEILGGAIYTPWRFGRGNRLNDTRVASRFPRSCPSYDTDSVDFLGRSLATLFVITNLSAHSYAAQALHAHKGAHM
jgi:hypothetical protein